MSSVPIFLVELRGKDAFCGERNDGSELSIINLKLIVIDQFRD
jgi:hypothetical protein